MDSKEILLSIVESFFESNAQNLIYLSLSERLINQLKEILEEDVSIIDLQSEYSPLKPFLKIIKDKNPDKNVVDNATYSLQRETFHSYFQNGYAEERNDIIVREEINYEKNRIRETVIELLKKYVSGKYFILNAQLLSEEALEILRGFEKSDFNGKFAFCFNGLKIEDTEEFMREFVHEVANKPTYYSIDTTEDFEESIVQKKQFFNMDYIELKHVLSSYNQFLALGEGSAIIKKIESDATLRSYEKDETRRIYYEMGLICFYNNELDQANYYFGNVAESPIGDEVEQMTTFYLANVSFLKNLNTMAIRYVNKNKQLLKNSPNQRIQALNGMMEYIINERIRDDYSVQFYLDVLDNLEKNNLTNNKINTSLVIPWSVIYKKKLRTLMLGKIKEAYMQSAKLDNIYGLSTACHWLGICLAQDGKKQESLEWYDRCRVLREGIGEIVPVIKVTNGLAYEYLNKSEYQKSYDLINGFVAKLLDTNDYPEIIITLANIGRALFYARNFEASYSLFQTTLDMLYIFDLQDIYFNSFMPEYNDIMAYKSIIDFFNGEYTRAKMNLHNITCNGKYFTPIEEILKTFLMACVEVQEKKVPDAIEVFEAGIKRFLTVGENLEHRLVFFYYEFALILKKAGYDEKAEEYKNLGFVIAKEKELEYYTLNRPNISLFDYLENVKTFAPLNIDLDALEVKAEKERLMNQLHKRLRDSQFLNKLMSFSVDTFSEKKYLANSIQAVFDYTMCEAVFIAEKESSNWNIKASSLRSEVKEPSVALWNELLGKTSNISPNHIKHEDGFDILFVNLSKFEFTGGIIIYLQKKLWLSAEEMSTLNIAVNNIQSQLVMFKQNQHLTVISSTDQLSQLKNRYALQEHLAFQAELLARSEKKQKGSMYASIIFVDLDNFKYYNDTFGHEAGDLLISCMGHLLSYVFRKVDFVSRYGGDEFVIVLPNTSCKEAKRSGERLYEALHKSSYFVPDLEHLLGRKLKISKDKRLGFSIGISCTTANVDVTDIEETLVNADQALYYSKAHGKGIISIWSDVKDKIEASHETLKQKALK